MKKRPILVIDDQRNFLDLISVFLQNHDYTVHTYQNVEEGLAGIEELNPALVLCDFRMPEYTGIEVCNIVRERKLLPMGFFLIVTAHVEPGQESDDFHDQPDGWLPKNVDMEQFCESISQWYKMVPPMEG